jgi:hypothetical protein
MRSPLLANRHAERAFPTFSGMAWNQPPSTAHERILPDIEVIWSLARQPIERYTISIEIAQWKSDSTSTQLS